MFPAISPQSTFDPGWENRFCGFWQPPTKITVSGAKSTMTVGKFFKADPCDAERLGNTCQQRATAIAVGLPVILKKPLSFPCDGPDFLSIRSRG
jgi:hypothetical protein